MVGPASGQDGRMSSTAGEDKVVVDVVEQFDT